MDLNQLYSDHQVLLVRADQSPTLALSQHYTFGATLIAGRIGCMQRALGAKAATHWETLALPDQAGLTGRSHGVGIDDRVAGPCRPREMTVPSHVEFGSISS